MPSWLSFLLSILGKIMELVTPELKELLKNFALDFYQKAKQTPNPADDILAALILALLNIPIPTT
jgi:hypothetical protein